MGAWYNGLYWPRGLGKRIGDPPGIVYHHSASDTDSKASVHKYAVETLHYRGAPYNWGVTKYGIRKKMRPLWAMGGHCHLHNDWLGLVAFGALHKHKMPYLQKVGLRRAARDMHKEYQKMRDKQHKEMPDNYTACPGKYYPFAYITEKAAAVVTRKEYREFKFRLLRYAAAYNRAHPDKPIDVPRIGWAITWGGSISKLAWRVSGKISGVKQTAKPTKQLFNALKG